jgi:hypothetical protein
MAHEGGSHGYDYNPYHSIGNDPPTTFSVLHGGPSHGYDYSPYHTPGNDPHPSFGMAHEGRSYGYDHGPHNTASDIPPPTFGSAHYSNHIPYYSITNDPPPTFCPYMTSRDREEEEYQQQLEEATRQSQADIRESLRKITASIVRNGMRFISSTLIHHLVQVGPAADLMRWTLTWTTSDSWQSLQGQYKARSDTDIGIPQHTILCFGKKNCRCALAATHICSFQVYLLCFYFPRRGI